ncbi:MAG: MBOAT family protein [Candidatus Acidiferrales bacterium]
MNTAPQDERRNSGGRQYRFLSWLPLLLFVTLAIRLAAPLPSWAYMCVIAFAIYFGLKWLTWWLERENIAHTAARSAAYLLAWPGMDAAAFLGSGCPHTPKFGAWCWAVSKTCTGILLLWVCTLYVPTTLRLLQGWIGLLALILILHFGSFELIALGWQTLGVEAQPIMQRPLPSHSLRDFLGRRWNLGFRQLSHEFIFQPFHRIVGAQWATLLVFLVSGLIHESVISVPARGGYGLPTLYFLIQGAGVLVERSRTGRFLKPQQGFGGWTFMAAVTAAPAYWLFHPPFVLRVALPLMRAIRAI